MTATGSFQRWERFMFVFVFANFLVIPLAIFSHPRAGAFVHGLVVPGVSGGFNSTSVLLVIAIVGTTVAPWQLFFQQSNIVDKRITPRWINYERTDTVIGSLITVFAASLIIAVCAVAFAHTKEFGHFTNAKGVASGLAHFVGHGAGAMFAIILLNASIIGAAAVTLATSYAFGDVFGVHHSLHRGWREAKFFYGTFSGMVFAGGRARAHSAGAARSHHHRCSGAGRRVAAECDRVPSSSVQRQGSARTLGQQTAHEHRLERDRVDPAHAVAHPDDDDGLHPHRRQGTCPRARSHSSGRVRRGRSGDPDHAASARSGSRAARLRVGRRETWRMPRLSLLDRPKWSRGRMAGMYALRVYLVVAVVLLFVKAVELGVHK